MPENWINNWINKKWRILCPIKITY